MGVFLSSDGNMLPGILVGGFFVALLCLVIVALITLIVLAIYFIKRKDDFVIEEITVDEPKPYQTAEKEREESSEKEKSDE